MYLEYLKIKAKYMKFKNLIYFVFLVGTLSACSSTKEVATADTSESDNDEVVAQNTRENNDELETLFWARRDSTTLNFVQADVDFMQGMIGHHSQALIMSSLAKPNNASRSVQTLAARIINAQRDEIRIMQQWLADRNQTVPQVKIEGLNLILTPGSTPKLDFTEEAVISGLSRHTEDDHSVHREQDMDFEKKEKPEEMRDKMHQDMDAQLNRSSNMGHMANNGMGEDEEDHANMDHSMMMHDHSDMPGMLNQTQLEELAVAQGKDFDKLFLRYMIQHHAGAITMVNKLVETDGAVQDVGIGKLAGDINVDQKTEIERMRLMLYQIMEAEEGE